MKKLAVATAVLLLISLGSAAAAYRWVFDAGSPGGKEVKVAITHGTSGAAIAEQLQAKGVVDSALAFRIYLRAKKVNTDLRAGEYNLRGGMPFGDIVAKMKKGPAVEFVKLVIPEGLTLEQTAKQVEKMTHISAADFKAAATPKTARPSMLPEGSSNLEGFLYPATYYVEDKETAATLVQRLVKQFERKIGSLEGAKSSTLGRTPYDQLIIASMIEQEAKAESERGKVSAVIHNRLRKGIPLGIDATIQYAVGKYAGEPLTQSDLEIDSPYNSRKFQGLPPTPIGSPRADSYKAALKPEDVDFLYYVLTEDCIHHLFTADYSEFERGKARQPRNC